MTDDVYERARVVRHTLTPWTVLLGALLLGAIPVVGTALSILSSVFGIIATGRIALYGFWKQSVLLLILYGLLIASSLFFLFSGIGEAQKRDSQRMIDHGFDKIGNVIRTKEAQTFPNHLPRNTVERPPERIIQREVQVQSVKLSAQDMKEASALIFATLEAQHLNSWGVLENLIAPVISFNGEKFLAVDYVHNLKERFSNWPERREIIQGDASIIQSADSDYIATFTTKFEFRKLEEFSLTGQRNHEMTFSKESGRLLLRSHSVIETVSPKPMDQVVRPHIINVQEFILEALDDEHSGRFVSLTNRYANEVEYFGKIRQRSEVIQDKADYKVRWPFRHNQLLGSIEASMPDGSTIIVKFPTQFLVSNAESNERRTGLIWHDVTLNMVDGKFQITKERGEVSHLEKSMLSPTTEAR